MQLTEAPTGSIEGFRLSPQQKHLWSLQASDREFPYRTQCTVLIQGSLNLQRLEAAIAQTVKQNEILRTRFILLPGMSIPLQVITDRKLSPATVADLTQLTADEQATALESLRQATNQHPLDIAEGLLLHYAVASLSEQRHLLLFSVSAFCTDFPGLKNLVAQVSRFYAANQQSSEGSLLQYADLAEWQNQLLEDDDRAPERAYWVKQVSQELLTVKLPWEQQRPNHSWFDPQIETKRIAADRLTCIRAIAETYQMSIDLVLFVCWQILLGRVTEQQTVMVGLANDGRKYAELQDVVGLLTRYLPLRCAVDGTLSISQLCQQVLQAVNQAELGQEYFSWEQITNEFNHPTNAFLPFCFEFAEPQTEYLADNVLFTITHHYNCVDRFKIKLSCWIQDDALIAEFHYGANDYLKTDIQRLANQFETLLENVLDCPKAIIQELDIVSAAERQQLLIDFNATETAYPQDQCIHTLFEEQCDRTPNHVAVVFEDQHLTYAELNAQANQLAQYLQSLGVKPEVPVAICMERSLEMIIGIFGILKAGGAYVPLDPAYPSDRLAFILQDTQSPVLLTQQGLIDKLPDRQHAKTLCLSAERESWSSVSPANPISDVTSDHLAYIIYTSGSTGQPKGVMVTHQNLVHSTTARFNYYHEPLSHFLLLSSYSFDSSIASIFWTLCQGATLVLPQPCVQQDPDKIVQLIARQQISHLLCLPSLYALVLAQASPRQMASLRTAIVAGEPCSAKLVNLHYEQLPQAILFNEYGPTEATVWSSVHRCQPQDLDLPVPIGHPISNTQIYLLDDQQRLVPIGILGELYVGGEGVARGYLNRPDLTSEKFVTNPFSDQPTARLYRTGDLARYRSDGSLEFLDRIDQQVKIRGFRIELGEIEGMLAQHPHIQDAVVLSWADPAGEKRLVAYIVADLAQLLTTSELRRFLNEKLPEYMLPTTFIKLKALPRLPNGKLDRRALPAPDLSRPDLDTRFVAPRTPVEQQLAQVWAEVLGLEQVGMHDNFFELGGDSIRSIQVMAKARAFGLNFSLQQLFQSQTIEQLAQVVDHTEQVHGSELGAAFSLISADDRVKLPPNLVDAYPLAALQAGMLFHSEYSTNSSLYHDLISLYLRAPFDEQKLRLAFQAMTMRHPVLRTSFDLSHFSVPLQLVHCTVEIPLVVEDLRHLSDRDRLKVLNDAFETEKQQHFDWQQPPLLRVRVHRRTDETFQLTMVEHHAILDGWSTATLLTEVFQQYFALLNDSVSPLEPAPAIAFRDFVALEQQAVQSLELQQYWMHTLSDLTVTHLPRWQQSERSSSLTRQLGVLDVPLSADLSNSLKALAKQARVPLKSVVLAAHLRVMRLLGNQADVLTGLVANGRPEEASGERMLGLFLNTLPFRLNLLGGTWLDLIQATFQAEQAALPYRRYPLAEVQRILGGKPLFEMAFNFIHFHVYQGLSGLVGLDVLDVKSFEQTNFTLVANFSLNAISSLIQLTLTYDANDLSEAQVEAIAGYYVKTLAAMVAQPSLRYESVPLLSESERHQLLVEWNPGQATTQEGGCLHQQFEAQVERTPNAVAVSFEGASLTYQTLNQQANQLARYLQKRGITPGTLVGICVDRSLDLVIGLLAILKAGGAYVPVDPIYPAERLGFMLADSQVSVLLTQQRLVAGLPEHRAQIICLDADWSAIDRESLDNLTTQVKPEDLAYVIYTSGSTGKPKGVLVQHDNVSRLFTATQPWFKFNDRDVWTLFHSYAFDFSVWELWGALLYGGRLVMVPACISRSPQAFYELLCREQVTVLNQTPSAFRQLMQVEELLEPSLEHLDLQLRYVIFGGEALELQSLQPWFERHSDVSPRLVNMYGITETTVHVTYRPLSKADLTHTGSAIGRPLPDLQVYLLDQWLQPVPIGVAGELYIGGGGVTRGYLNRPELTRDRFIPHPFSDRPDARLYKSGDLARYLPNGDLEYLGRIDRQVKIHGFRIELGEIEAALTQHLAVGQTVAIARDDELNNKRLVAYIVPDQKYAFPILQLLRFQNESLLNEGSLYELPNGMMVAHLNKNKTEFVYKKLWEEQAYLKHGITINEGDCIFDVGANIGLFTLFVGQICKDVSIYAFEPIPPVFDLLRINAESYGLNVKLFNIGLSSDTKSTTFTYYPQVSGVSRRFADAEQEREVIKSFLLKQQNNGSKNTELSSQAIDELLAERLHSQQFICQLRTISDVIRAYGLEQIDLLKIDVEKSEQDVLCGIQQEDWQKIQQMVIEVHNINGRLEEIASLLKKHGYDLTIEQDTSLEDTVLYNIYARRPSINQCISEEPSSRLVSDCVKPTWNNWNLLVSELRHFLQKKLPEYMVPSAFVLLESLPLTPNGKIDHPALPQPDLFQRSLTSRFVAPRTLTEEMLASVWSDILKVESSIHDSFFELGGHSLLATQLISRLRSAFAIDLPLRSLFEFPTIAELATHIEALCRAQQSDQTGATDTAVVFPLLVPDPDRQDQPFPLTDIQQAYWMGRTGAFDLGNVSAHSYIELESEHLELERLTQALHKLIACHTMLRAVVLPDGQQQILTDVPAYQIAVLDLSGQNATAIAVALETVRQQMSHQVLPADHWPLFEIRATRFRAQHIRLHISFDALIADAWSIRCLAQQLVQLYQYPDQDLTAPELSFRDYVLAEERLQTTDFYRRCQTYWFDRLNTLPPAPELPLAKQPSAITQPKFKGRSFHLNSEHWQKLKHWAAQGNLTPSAVILATFAEVLTLWSKSPRFTINLTLFNRLPFHPQVDRLVGDFTSLTLLEVDNSAKESLSTRAQRLQRQLWQDLDHRYVSGVRVLRELTRRQGGGQTAAMPVVFTSTLSLNTLSQSKVVPYVLGEVVYNISQTPQVWLDHQVAEEAGGLLLNWDAVEELFPAGLLDDMFDTYCRLIGDLATSQSAWVESDRSLLPAHQLDQRTAINATAVPRSGQLLQTLFTAQVEARSHSYAVLSPSRNLTYAELSQRAHQVGHQLRQMGVMPNTLVGVVMEKGWEQVVAVLGILLSGAAYLPVDPELPTERQQYLLQQANVRIVLTQSKLNLTLNWSESIQRICVDNDELAGMATSVLQPVQTPEDLAYVIYTSGSTGLPKGVMIDHQGAVNTVLDINRRFQVTSRDRVLALSALSFDLSVYDIFGMLVAGGTIVIPAVAEAKNPSHWLALIQQHQVTIWNSVPALLQMLVESVTDSPLSSMLDSLRLALLSGDWVPLHLPNQVKALLSDIQIVSLGGATEASIWSIYYPIEHVHRTWKSIPYGQPLANQSFHVLNQHLDHCPVWVPGQLYIGGIGLAQGYWQDEQKTHDRFIIHPQTQERLYKTGDLGRYLPDGNIEFLGREDFQVKVSGYRIELGEIEAALTEHPAVKEVVVTAVGEEQAYKQLAAYVVIDPERVPGASSQPSSQLMDAYEPCKLSNVLSDSGERLAFKLKQPGVRQFPAAQLSVALPQPELDQDLMQMYLRRQSYRQFLDQPIPLAAFSHFLSCLLQRELAGALLPKYRYPSAGNLYPVQTYLYLKPNRVAGLDAGFYYYHPANHRLVLLNAKDHLTGDFYGGNQPIFEQSAFALFLIGHLDAIAPMYGELARDFCLLEAGYMSQLLMTQAPDHQLGLCPIGFLELDPLQNFLSLDSGQILLHSFVGGSIDPAQTQQWLAPQPTQIAPLEVQLRQSLQQKLPEYMIPKAFVLLEKFPLTSNGKIDRAALPAPVASRSAATPTYVAPRTELEQMIAAIWQEVLQIEQIGLHDNFFDLGGHSLFVIQVHRQLQERLNRELSVIELFRSPTISALAKHLSQDAINPATALHTPQMDDMQSGRNRLKQRLAQTKKSANDQEEQR